MKAHQKPIGANNEWLTPRWILDSLGKFDLDPCAPVNRPWNIAAHHFTIEDDGLSKKWFGRVWCNPPFDKRLRPLWMNKMSDHNNGIMLIPAAGETRAFKKYVWGKCSGILILKRRPHFCHIDGTPASGNSGCTISLVAYGENNLEILKTSNLGFTLKEIESRKAGSGISGDYPVMWKRFPKPET